MERAMLSIKPVKNGWIGFIKFKNKERQDDEQIVFTEVSEISAWIQDNLPCFKEATKGKE